MSYAGKARYCSSDMKLLEVVDSSNFCGRTSVPVISSASSTFSGAPSSRSTECGSGSPVDADGTGVLALAVSPSGTEVPSPQDASRNVRVINPETSTGGLLKFGSVQV
jgi:hypothetical protein